MPLTVPNTPRCARMIHRAGIVALTLALSTVSACLTPQQAVTLREDDLSAAGFTVKPANTPERQAMLNRLPPHKFVRRVDGDTVHYVYADPLVCDCLYVGTEQAYNQYKRDQQQKHLVDEQQMAAEMYADPAWNWGAWGPFGPEYGFRYGRMGW